MRFSGDVLKVPMDGTVSQIFSIGPGFCFMKSRKKCFETVVKVSHFFK